MLNDMGEMGELPLDDQAAAEKGNQLELKTITLYNPNLNLT